MKKIKSPICQTYSWNEGGLIKLFCFQEYRPFSLKRCMSDFRVYQSSPVIRNWPIQCFTDTIMIMEQNDTDTNDIR